MINLAQRAKELKKVTTAVRQELRKLAWMIAGLIFILLIILWGAYSGMAYLEEHLFQAVDPGQDSTVVVNIDQGLSTRQIVRRLKNEKLIRSELSMMLYLKALERDIKEPVTLKAGSYELSPSMSVPLIAEMLIKGRVIDNSMRITIPEGLTVREIDIILAKDGAIEEEGALFELSRSVEWYQALKKEYAFLPNRQPDVILSNPRASLFEGYLFPDTYLLTSAMKPEDVLKKFLSNFQKKVVYDISVEDYGDLNRVVVLASILEEEVRSGQDMRLASDVLQKRLRSGMKLQVDSSVNYFTGLSLQALDNKSLQRDTPYNTYMYEGLPPSAISNPGLKAIEAAINPQPSEFWYYLTGPDGTTFFSKTFEEHLANKARYLK